MTRCEELCRVLRASLCEDKLTTLKLSVPAIIYAVQNNLQMVAALYLGAVTLHVLERIKVLATAIMSALILGRVLTKTQWTALILIILGVVMTQKGNGHESSSKSTPQEVTIGVWAALTVSLLSSFAGVYLEKMIKADQVSLPVRNVQLCLYSVPLQLLRIVSDREYDRVMPSALPRGCSP